VPLWPAGSSAPVSSSQIFSSPITALPTVPLCASHCAELQIVTPLPSVPA